MRNYHTYFQDDLSFFDNGVREQADYVAEDKAELDKILKVIDVEYNNNFYNPNSFPILFYDKKTWEDEEIDGHYRPSRINSAVL